jgi:hypothetical protein
VTAGFERADPIIGLRITLVILKITCDSWRVISTTEQENHTATITEKARPRSPDASTAGRRRTLAICRYLPTERAGGRAASLSGEQRASRESSEPLGRAASL